MPRNILADALRGLAGLCVVLFHICEPFEHRAHAPDWPQLCGHGYLCVEFFLLLMGYMLAYAYDRRWADGMTIRSFFVRRLRRLHPLVVSGVILGFALLWVQGPSFPYWQTGLRAYGWGELSLLALASAALLPIFGYGFICPFNPCSWTLVYEYLANILYALFVRRFGKATLAVLSVASGLWFASFALHVDLNALFGLSNEFLAKIPTCTRHSIEIGWSGNAVHAYGACVRLAFPFFFGLLLARLNWKIRLPRFALPLGVAAFLALLFAPMPLGTPRANGLYEMFCLMVAFPALILLGAGTEVKNAKVIAVTAFLAELSYPLYMTHYPFMLIHNWWVWTHSAPFSAPACLLIGAAEFASLVALSILIMKFWDEPIRRRLTKGTTK